MPPETPRPSLNRAGNSLTPSFTFGLGLSPSFRFTSPRNINILSSISPHRFFTRFSKRDDDNLDPEHLHPDAAEQAPSKEETDMFSYNKDDKYVHPLSLSQKSAIEMDSASDLMCTTESVEMWSLANENHSGMNLTSIHEDIGSKEVFLSPDDIFLDKDKSLELSALKSSPLEENAVATPTRKRRRSTVAESPCKALAMQIGTLGSPQRQHDDQSNDAINPTKLWTADLDECLLRCFDKYKVFKQTQSSDSVVFRYTSQNRILSRMLQNKTGVLRTAKQISSRLLRLTKHSDTPKSAPSFKKSPSECSGTIFSSPPDIVVTESAPASKTPDLLSLEQLLIAFNYKLNVPSKHIFTTLNQKTGNLPLNLSLEEAEKLLPYDNNKFVSDFAVIAPKLVAQNVLIHNIYSEINFKPNDATTSTPTSPLTNPLSFNMENGTFLSYTKVVVPRGMSNESFLCWKSSISIYKDSDKVLLRSKEIVNGYRNEAGNFELEVPFLSNFWSGYLTYLSNGSNMFEDVKSLLIVQVIYDGENETSGCIRGVFIYRFDLAVLNGGYSSVSSIRLKSASTTNEVEAEEDDNATVLATSSPYKPSPTRGSLSIKTELANTCTQSGPLTAPTMNAALLHKFNPNYGMGIERPPMQQTNSTNSIYVDASSNTPELGIHNSSLGMATPLSAPATVRHQSAGQIVSHMPPHPQATVPVQTFANNVGPSPMPTQFIQSNFLYPPQYREDPSVMGMNYMAPYPHAVNANMHGMAAKAAPRQQWAMNDDEVKYMLGASSAPPSQLQFFPATTAGPPAAKESKGPVITFGPILEYDPSRDMKLQTKRAKHNVNFHRFTLNPQVMYKPKRK